MLRLAHTCCHVQGLVHIMTGFAPKKCDVTLNVFTSKFCCGQDAVICVQLGRPYNMNVLVSPVPIQAFVCSA